MQIGLKSRQQTVAPRQLVVRPPLIEAFKRVWDGGPALAARDKVNIFDLVSAMVARAAPYHRVCALFASSNCALIVSCKQRPGAQLTNTRGCTRLRNRIRKAATTIPLGVFGNPAPIDVISWASPREIRGMWLMARRLNAADSRITDAGITMGSPAMCRSSDCRGRRGVR